MVHLSKFQPLHSYIGYSRHTCKNRTHDGNNNIEHPVPKSIKNKFEDNVKTKKELVDKIKSK